MEHDGERNRCGSVTSHGSIMAPLVQSRLNRFMWSSCSRKELMGSIRYKIIILKMMNLYSVHNYLLLHIISNSSLTALHNHVSYSIFIRNFHCLNDKPGKKHEKDLPFLHRYPGVHYSTDDQCLFDFGKGYKFCTAVSVHKMT